MYLTVLSGVAKVAELGGGKHGFVTGGKRVCEAQRADTTCCGQRHPETDSFSPLIQKERTILGRWEANKSLKCEFILYEINVKFLF